jgi:REP element-mobilizing transposase RayT
MTNYRRNFVSGGDLFFTVNLEERRSLLLTERMGPAADSISRDTIATSVRGRLWRETTTFAALNPSKFAR